MPCREVLCLCGNRRGKLIGSWLRAGVFVCGLSWLTDWYTSADRGSSSLCAEFRTFTELKPSYRTNFIHPGELTAVRHWAAFSQSQRPLINNFSHALTMFKFLCFPLVKYQLITCYKWFLNSTNCDLTSYFLYRFSMLLQLALICFFNVTF